MLQFEDLQIHFYVVLGSDSACHQVALWMRGCILATLAALFHQIFDEGVVLRNCHDLSVSHAVDATVAYPHGDPVATNDGYGGKRRPNGADVFARRQFAQTVVNVHQACFNVGHNSTKGL